MERRELYAYTFPSYLKEGSVECKVKVGDSEIGRWEKRIQEQMGTATPESPIKQLIGLLPEDVRDYDVHSLLKKNGCKRIIDGKGREWFITNNKNDPFKAVRRAYNEITVKSSRTESYALRHEHL